MKSTILAAHQYGQPEVLEFAQYALPPLASGMARIHVKASGIIAEVDGSQNEWAVGDEVLGSGGAFTHATVIDVPLTNLIRKPKNIDWSIAGTIAGAAQTAMTILDEMGPAQSLLVHGGSGGVGSIVVQLAVEKGIEVVATASVANQDYIRKLGATPVTYGDGLVERLKAVHPTPFDVSIDMIGSEEATQTSLAVVKVGGFMGSIAGRKLSSHKIQPVWVKRNPKNLQHVVDGIADGRFTWTVSREYAFNDAQQAYGDILEGHTKGKSVLIFE